MNHLTRYPAEWELHDAVWLAWPSDPEPWEQTPIDAVQGEFTTLCQLIADPDSESGKPRGERLHILVNDAAAEQAARAALHGLQASFHRLPFGDIWLRDTAPIFVHQGKQTTGASFRFNGWGGKYIYPNDDTLSARIALASGLPTTEKAWILEGGSLDSDGEGTLLTTEECLLNTNRNQDLSRAEIEARLRTDLGAEKVLWLSQGLIGDHTDGHIDNIARFIGPGQVVCMRTEDISDPNYERMQAIHVELSGMTDAKGRRLKVLTIPAPPRVLDREGSPMPASHANFYIANTRVVVPMYPGSHDTGIIEALSAHFPDREVVGASSWNILHGGGSFHCITQQVPSSK